MSDLSVNTVSSNPDRHVTDEGGGSGGATSADQVTVSPTVLGGDDAQEVLELIATALAGLQPLDADLTAIAALTTTAIGRSLLAIADAAAGRTILGVDAAASRTTFNNANYPMVATDRYVAQVGTMSAVRTVTLMAANAVPAGTEIIVADESGTPTTTNTIRVVRAGADTINLTLTEAQLLAGQGSVRMSSDGTSNWTILSTPKPVRYVITGSGTHTVPISNYRQCRISGVAGGAGGGSGRKGLAAGGVFGGGGGSGGAVFDATVPYASLPASWTATIGAAGVGGASQPTNSTNGNAGTSGGSTTATGAGFDDLSALGGVAGGAGTTTTGTGGSGQTSQFANGAGGSSNNTTTGGTGAIGISPSGPAGAGVTVGGAALTGGAGRGSHLNGGNSAEAAPAGGTSSTNGTNATALGYTSTPPSGRSAGAGGSSVTTNAGAGGVGAGFGFGGAGGGGAIDSTGDSGAGGDGGPGCIVVEYW